MGRMISLKRDDLVEMGWKRYLMIFKRRTATVRLPLSFAKDASSESVCGGQEEADWMGR